MHNVTESGPRDPVNINNVQVPYTHQEFPKMFYHPELPATTVKSAEEAETLRDADASWRAKPYPRTAPVQVEIPMHPPATLFSLNDRMEKAERTILLQEKRIAELESALGPAQGGKAHKSKAS